MLSPASATVLDLKAGPFTAALVFLKTGRMSVCIKLNETLFQCGIGRVGAHAVSEATMRSLLDYSPILPTSNIKNPIRTPRTDSKRQPTQKHCKLREPGNATDKGRTKDNDEFSVGEALLTLG